MEIYLQTGSVLPSLSLMPYSHISSEQGLIWVFIAIFSELPTAVSPAAFRPRLSDRVVFQILLILNLNGMFPIAGTLQIN